MSGELAATEADALRNHLGGCPRCQATLEELSDHPDLRAWASDSGNLAALLVEPPELGQLLKRLGDTPPPRHGATPPETSVAPQSRPLLGPPEQPGDLGTLGKFRILSQLGRGGMGIVYRAYDRELARTVALKVLRWERTDEQGRARFVREAQAAARLEHENVVAVHGVMNPADGPPYQVMQYVAGRTLREEIEAAGQLDPREAARVAAQVADGLVAAHQAGLIHRDIKPANIILDAATGKPRIMDFGLVRVQQQARGMTEEGTIPGTPEYMSPEQIREPERIDERSDIYSLGVTLYEALTGEVPFRGASHMVLQQVLHHEPQPPRRLNDRIPRDLETICLKAMAKEPARRYQTAGDLRDDLRRWLEGETIRARPAGRIEKAWRWCRRRPREAALIASVAILLVAIPVGALYSAWRLRIENNISQENLRGSYLSQAQARRWSGQAGQRFKSLDVLAKAAAIRPGLDLRNEAVACLPLVDLRVVRQLQTPIGVNSDFVGFNSDLEQYARANPDGSVSIHRTSDDSQFASVRAIQGEIASECVFSPDDKSLLAYYSSGSCRLWNLQRGDTVLTVPWGAGSTQSGRRAFSADNRYFAISAGEGLIRIFDLPSGNERHQVKLGSQPARLAFHPREPTLAVYVWDSEQTVRLLNASTGQIEKDWKTPAGIHGFGWHPDGNLLAGGCVDDLVRIWDIRTGELHQVLRGHQNQVTHCVFNNAGDLLATCGWDISTRLWDIGSGRELVKMPGYCHHFSRDDRGLAYHFADLQRECGVWEVASGRECRTLRADNEQGDATSHAEFHADGRLMATACGDGVRLWDLAAFKQIAFLRLGRTSGTLFHPSGDSLISAGESGVQRWPVIIDSGLGLVRLGPPQTLFGPVSRGHQPSISRDGRRLAVLVDSREAVVIDLEQPEQAIRLASHPNLNSVSLSPDGRWAATGTQHGSGVKVWNAAGGELLKEIPVANYGWGIFTPDSRILITGSPKDAAQTWEVGSWKEVANDKGYEGGVFSADGRFLGGVFSADGRFFATRAGTAAARSGAAGGIELWDATTGNRLTSLIAPQPLDISGLSFASDGSQIAAACYKSHVVQIWNVRMVRAQLAAMNLDWELPIYRLAPELQDLSPLRVEVLDGTMRVPR